MSIKDRAHAMKLESSAFAATPAEVRNDALANVAQALTAARDEIFAANERDMQAAQEAGVPETTQKRLKFDEGKMNDVVAGINQLIDLPDPIGRVSLSRELDEGLVLTRLSCPIGVIGVIFEARPDALVQISSLCLKSGNCAVLKGGRETANTNRALFDIIYQAAVDAGLPENCLVLAEGHSEIDELLECDEDVDLLIPRGSNSFVRYIMDNTKIPVMGHSSGVCHIYIDEAADQDLALPIIVDAKTQYAAACNAVETLLVNRSIADDFLPKVAAALTDAGVAMRASEEAAKLLGCETMNDDEFDTEYGTFTVSVKLVDGVDEAVAHINRFGSHHTDAIITRDDATAEKFMALVDSAGVYRNCSTRFADGFRYGFGAEVGISTGKIHARGPVGLEGLTTYKYRLEGSGQIVGDYASGKAEFHFKDLA